MTRQEIDERSRLIREQGMCGAVSPDMTRICIQSGGHECNFRHAMIPDPAGSKIYDAAELEAALVASRQRPRKPDQIRVDRGDWHRASGLTTCTVCGCQYADHTTVRGFEWLTQLCDGRLVKL